MSDLISRQAAVDALHKRFKDGFDEDKWWNSTHVLETIKSVPSAQKKGEWIPVTKIYKVTEDQFPNMHIEWVDASEPDEIDAVRCSECGEVFDFQDARNWCAECGADMK